MGWLNIPGLMRKVETGELVIRSGHVIGTKGRGVTAGQEEVSQTR